MLQRRKKEHTVNSGVHDNKENGWKVVARADQFQIRIIRARRSWRKKPRKIVISNPTGTQEEVRKKEVAKVRC